MKNIIILLMLDIYKIIKHIKYKTEYMNKIFKI